jgi:hypothetical protein
MSTTISRRHLLVVLAIISICLLLILFVVLSAPPLRLHPTKPAPPPTVQTTPHTPAVIRTVMVADLDYDGVKSRVAKVGNYLQDYFKIVIVYGKADRPGNPNSDHPRGYALDFMVPDKETGDRLNDCVLKHSKRWNIKYTLWQVPEHYNHVHVSFKDDEDGKKIKDLSCEETI